jgi:predicted pyridoxine 5'-phosphate oxidase superfamily flavin-nucleotide-binding protein
MGWKSYFKKGREVILATASREGVPHANIVISMGFVDDCLLVADCQMVTTIRNLQDNEAIAAVGGHVRIKGTVALHSSGKYFDICVKNSEGYEVRNAILIHVSDVFDLDTVTPIDR